MHAPAIVPPEPLPILMAAGPLPAAQVMDIGRAICDALTEPHGELWPSAITITEDGAIVAPRGSAERSRYARYASPECVLGKPATPASDVFSIAAILYQALAGRPPFRGDSPAAIMLAACTETPQPLPSSVPRALETIILRALSKDPADRYESPALLAHALLAYQKQGTWAGKRVLAADDDAPIRELYAHMAAHVGVEADIVATGRDAIEALKTRNYDVALLDLNMARLSGWEVLDFLRYRHRERPRHLYIVTGFNDQIISEADREMVTGVLYKPVAPEELRVLVTECLRGTAPDMSAILRTTGHRAVS